MAPKDKILGELPFYATGELSAEERASLREKVRVQVDEEVRKKLVADAMDEELKRERQRRAVLANPAAEPVSIRLSLPDNVTPWAALVVDSTAYWDGVEYTVPPHLAAQLRAMEQAAWVNQSRQEGRWTDRRGTMRAVNQMPSISAAGAH